MQNHPRLHGRGGPATPCSSWVPRAAGRRVPTEGRAVGLDPESPALFPPLASVFV